MTAAARWICDGCGRTRKRLTRAQYEADQRRKLPTCRRRRCTGRLYPMWPEATDRLIEDLRTNGAPGWTPGTPPKQAVPTEGATAMAHTLASETTPRGKQILAAITLGHLLETDPLAGLAGAPVPDWRIDALGRIHGHVPSHSDHMARRAIDEYANFLHADIRCEPNHDARSEWLNLSTSATYRGVPVNVWTHVAIRVTNPYGSTR